jgi:hypothetical protein
MSAVSVWLLVALGTTYGPGRNPAVIERFVTQEECEFVRLAIDNKRSDVPGMRCIQVRVAR